MAKWFMTQIRAMSNSELDMLESRLRAELSRLRTVSKIGGRVGSPALFKNLRRNIARIMTLRRERELGELLGLNK